MEVAEEGQQTNVLGAFHFLQDSSLQEKALT